MIGKLVLGFWILGWISLYGDLAVAQRWPTPLEESLDEMHDAEIFRAVVESMRQWSMQKKLHSRSKREVSKVCYEDVGCFEDTGPFSYLEMLPSPPKDVGTRFLVYGSRKARSIPMEVPADDIDDEAHRAIDPDLPTKVIVHGFGSSCDYVWVYEMRSALMAVHECNIVCVDWGPGSAVPNYVRAAANTRLVGRQLAKLVRSLKVPLEKIHLIGFSLGAHVAGFAGAELGNVSRITGLDPAGPLFESQDPRARLDETDANFVDVIHSNGEQLILGGLGSSQPMGDVDFYPNGGRMQTGCSNLFVGAVSDIIWSSAVEGRSLCNHRRAYKLFTDSVSPKCRFPAFPCSRGYDGLLRGDCFPCGSNDLDRPCGDMGYYSDESPARGQLYLVTRDEEPFCAHQYQVKVYNSRSERPARSYGKLQVTLVGEDSFNDTFAMTRKDEELLVGAILQKIIVPHPAVSNLEAIEIKYTAYSGWISSGLVSWSIDKVAVVDSFGKTLSVCKKGLSLESGRAIYLPLFPGECNIPVESDNSSSSTFERLVKEKPGGIGPFTKEHNYETKDFSSEGFSREKTSPSRGLGPFTKEQNLRSSEPRDALEDSSGRRGSLASSWNVIDVSGDAGDSNSLENADAESGRGFSGSNLVAQEPPVHTSSDASTEFLPEIREPVLRVGKKETVGRSLKLTEITEPILRPRPTRQNGNGEGVVTDAAGCPFAGDCRGSRNEEPQEASPSTTRSFTVQFLPERLAGILAQAEKYARQTLLPLISQYTPSFVGGGRRDEPKYFPPLGDIVGEESTEEATSIEISSRIDETEKEDSSGQSSEESSTIAEEIHRENSSGGSSEREELERSNEWVPVGISSRRDLEASRSLAWETGNYTWHEESTRNTENTTVKMEFDDWVPITIESEDRETSTSVLEESTASTSTEKEANVTETTATKSSEEGKDERKYIPLIDPEGDKPPTTSSNDIPESSSASSFTHIQKIPRSKETDASTRRTMVFPYAYERNKDPRTRYIPLIPEEDLERPRRFFSERER